VNLEIEKFKKEIAKLDFNSELGFCFLEENVYNENTENEFFQYKLKNDLNKIISFTYYPCNRPVTSNEIALILIYPNGGSTNLSDFLAYKQLNRRLSYEDVLQYRFKVDCDKLEQSIQFQLQKISTLLNGELKIYLMTEEWIFIPMHDPRDDY